MILYTEPTETLYLELYPSALELFAKTQGFKFRALHPKSVTYDLGGFELDIPTSTTFADYPRRVAEILDTLSAATGIPIPGLLHAIDPDTFPVSRILRLLGLP